MVVVPLSYFLEEEEVAVAGLLSYLHQEAMEEQEVAELSSKQQQHYPAAAVEREEEPLFYLKLLSLVARVGQEGEVLSLLVLQKIVRDHFQQQQQQQQHASVSLRVQLPALPNQEVYTQPRLYQKPHVRLMQ